MYKIFKYLWNGGEVKAVPLNKDDIKTYSDVHYSHVYNDSDFKQDLAELRNLHNNDIEATINEVAKRGYFEPLADKWHITPEEVNSAYDGGEEDGTLLHGADGRTIVIDIDAFKTQNKVMVEIDILNTKKMDIEELWKELVFAKASRGIPPTRNRHPEDPKLIYSVFKSRMKGDTYSTIFRRYQDGTLIGYKDVPSNQFKSEDSLERYYRKYVP